MNPQISSFKHGQMETYMAVERVVVNMLRQLHRMEQ
jgi:hypothetical protein